jgi:D-sedoheptulose 7-phosphate isomerase
MLSINFENIEQKCIDACNTSEYKRLVEKVRNSKKLFLMGNGGLHYVASHMATDLTRLIPDKTVYSFDSVGFITSNANDHGFENMFVRWLETTAMVESPDDCLMIGLSCSGNSSNIINALHWADEKGFSTFMVSGQKSQTLNSNLDELVFNCDFFHTVEVMSLIVFYDLIHQSGNHCPSIDQEKRRMAGSSLRGGSGEME